jgi:hypothetical protein
MWILHRFKTNGRINQFGEFPANAHPMQKIVLQALHPLKSSARKAMHGVY